MPRRLNFKLQLMVLDGTKNPSQTELLPYLDLQNNSKTNYKNESVLKSERALTFESHDIQQTEIINRNYERHMIMCTFKSKICTQMVVFNL